MMCFLEMHVFQSSQGQQSSKWPLLSILEAFVWVWDAHTFEEIGCTAVEGTLLSLAFCSNPTASAGGVETRNLSENLVCWSTRSQCTAPSNRRAHLATRGNPSPNPSGFEVTNGSNISLATSGGGPLPLSHTVNNAKSPDICTLARG